MINEIPLYFQEFLKDFGSFRSNIDARFDLIDKRFEAIDQRFSNVDKNISDLAASTAMAFLEVQQRFDQVDKYTTETRQHVLKIELSLVEDYGRRISNLEKAFLNS